MTEEFKSEHECLCKSKGFRKFVTVALGTFVGAFCALSLFSALHKPPMMIPPMGYGPQFGHFGAPCNCGCAHHKMQKPDFDKKFIKHHKDFKDAKNLQKEEKDD